MVLALMRALFLDLVCRSSLEEVASHVLANRSESPGQACVGRLASDAVLILSSSTLASSSTVLGNFKLSHIVQCAEVNALDASSE